MTQFRNEQKYRALGTTFACVILLTAAGCDSGATDQIDASMDAADDLSTQDRTTTEALPPDMMRPLEECLPCSPPAATTCYDDKTIARRINFGMACGEEMDKCTYLLVYPNCVHGCNNGDCRRNHWLAVPTTGAPSARYNHTAVWTGTEMIVWGGHAASGAVGDGAAYNPTTNTWRTLATTGAPSAREEHAAVMSGSNMMVWGGRNGTQKLGDGAVYIPKEDRWEAISTTGAPVARAGHKLVAYAFLPPPPFPNMVVLGGTAESGIDSEAGSFDVIFKMWRYRPGLQGIKTNVHDFDAAWTGVYVVALGGLLDNGSYSDKDYRYNPVLDPEFTSPDADVPDMGTGATALIAQWKSGTNNEIAMFPRARHTVTSIGGTEVVVWGGQPQDSTADPRIPGHLDVAANTWSEGPVTGAPSRRLNHTAVWTGSDVIVWGGKGVVSSGFAPVFNDGARYFYDGTRRWQAISAQGAPTARHKHTMVWAGEEMIVWGGLSGDESDPQTTSLATGGRYAP